MESSSDKQWAQKYLLDPLTAPEPSEETGLNSHFSSTMKAPKVTTTSSGSRSTSPKSSYPTPPNSASPTRSQFSSKNPYAPSYPPSSHRQSSGAGPSKSASHSRNASAELANTKTRRRGSSLTEKFPGDMSHRPLDQLRKETKAANRSPHLKKKHLPGADTIDSLDKTMFGLSYHHEGPYDATLLARNTSYKSSPVAATQQTNEEAIRATPKEYIKDSLTRHVPLQGTSVIPPGEEGFDGKPMIYVEGADLMREEDAPGGAYKRWDHIKYLPGDLKGKGEPSYSIEKALKEHESSKHRRAVSNSESNTFEMQPDTNRHLRPGASRQRSISGDNVNADRAGVAKPTGSSMRYVNLEENDMRRSNSTGNRIGAGLKKRFGSLRRSRKDASEI